MYLKNVPTEWVPILEKDVAVKREALKQQLEQCALLNDTRKGAKWYTTRLEYYLDCRYPLSLEDRAHLAKQLMSILFASTDVTQQGRWANTVARLIKKTLASSEPFGGRLDLVLEWRPLYNLIQKVVFPAPGSVPCINQRGKGAFTKAIARLVDKAKHYWPPSAFAELLEELNPKLCPFDESYYRSVCELCLFLPTRNTAEIRPWLPSFIDTMKLVDHSHGALLASIKLLGRVAKHNLGELDWAPYLPYLFSTFLQNLKLPIGSQKPSSSSHAWSDKYDFFLRTQVPKREGVAIHFARVVLYTLYSGSPTLDLLLQLFNTIRTFFHPSNNGHWAHPLAIFLNSCSFYYVKRAQQQSSGVAAKNGVLDLKDLRFATALLDFAGQGLLSKNERVISMCAECVRNLAYVHPDLVFPKLTAEFYPALTTTDQSHRMMSTFKTLTLVCTPMFSRTTYPAGAEHLEQLLWLALPGIDSTDPIKTARTLSWLEIVFYNVPFISALESDERKKDSSLAIAETKGDDEARSVTLMFEEWSLAFVQKLLDMLEAMEDYTQGKKNHITVMFATMLEKIFDAFTSALSQSILVQCLKPVVEAIKRPKGDVVKYFGLMISSFAFAQPKITLEAALPTLLKAVQVEGTPDSDLKWYVYLISQAVKRAGKCVIPYLPQLKQVSQTLRKHSNKMVSKLSLRVLRSALRALTSLYPLEKRPLSPEIWKEDEKWAHWRTWGCDSEIESNLNVQWHFPSTEELELAHALVLEELQEPLTFLQAEAENKDPPTDQRDQEVLKRLAIVAMVQRGVEGCLGIMEGPRLDTREQPRADKGVQLEDIPWTPMFKQFTIEHQSVTMSLRSRLADVFHQLHAHYLAVCTDAARTNVKLVSRLIKMTQRLAVVFGPTEPKTMRMKQLTRYEHHFQKNYYRGKKCLLRPMLVGKAHALLMRRQLQFQMGNPYNQRIQDLIEDAQKWSLSDFDIIREKAIGTLISCARRFPDSIDSVLNAALRVIDDSKSKDKQVTGAVSLLSQEQIAVWAVNKYRRIAAVALCLCRNGEQHKDDKVQTLFHNLFLVVFATLSSLPLSSSKLAVPAEGQVVVHLGSSLSSAAVQERNAAIEQENALFRTQYVELVDQLAVIANNKSVHWRYSLMATSFLVALIRPEVSCDSLVDTLSKGLLSDIAPMRQCCLIGVTRLLRLQAQSTPKAYVETQTTDAAEIQTLLSNITTTGDFPLRSFDEESWRSTGVLDLNYSGWDGKHLKFRSYAAQTEAKYGYFSAGAAQSTEEFLRQFIGNVFSAMERNHPTLSKTQDASQGAKGAGDTIAQQAYFEPSINNYSRVAMHSSGVDRIHIMLVANLVRCFPSLLLGSDVVFNALSKLTTQTHEEEPQCVAAEIVAGIIRGIRHWSWKDQVIVQSKLEPLLQAALTACQPDCVVHWMDSLRNIWSNSDPRRHTWLYRSLCFAAFPDKVVVAGNRADLTSTICKQLRFIQPALVESSWKMCAVGQWLLPRIKDGWLRDPYTQVRQAVSQVLFLITHNTNASDAVLPSFATDVSSVLGSLNYLKSNAGEAKTNPEDQYFIETALHWVMACLSWDTAPLQATLLKLLPHVLKAQHHTDPQCNALAKHTALSLAWVRGLNVEGVASVLASITELSQIQNWELRVSCFKFLQVFIPRHSYLLSDAQIKALLEVCELGLVELRVEVRQSACAALASLASSCVISDKRRDLFIKRSLTKSKTKVPNTKPLNQEALAQRHGGVLGLSVYVIIHPYDVPAFLPPVLAKLASHISDPPPIDKAVKTLLVDFKSTHKDEWDRFKTQFTLEELEAVEQAEIAPSYFA